MLQTLWGITAPSLQAYSNETASNKQTQAHTKWKWGTLASSERAEYWFNLGLSNTRLLKEGIKSDSMDITNREVTGSSHEYSSRTTDYYFVIRLPSVTMVAIVNIFGLLRTKVIINLVELRLSIRPLALLSLRIARLIDSPLTQKFVVQKSNWKTDPP